MVALLRSPWLVALLALVAVHVGCALYVHLRGKDRHTLGRQLTDHSTFLAPYNVLVYLASGVPTRPVLDPASLPELAALKDGWRTIRDEALRLHEAGHLRASERYDDLAFNSFFERGWKRFHLKWYREALPSARSLCPSTVALVDSIPSVNAALFALLPPHSRLGRHRDPFAGSLRYHLGLVTPRADGCRIVVDGEPHAWHEGEALLFDETFIHSARNDTDEPRIILFCDVARPIRNPVVRAINRFATRHVLPLIASRNLETERIGRVGRLAGWVHRASLARRRFKARGQRRYYAIKYALVLALVALATYEVLHLR